MQFLAKQIKTPAITSVPFIGHALSIMIMTAEITAGKSTINKTTNKLNIKIRQLPRRRYLLRLRP